MFRFEPLQSLFDNAPPYDKDSFKPEVLKDLKASDLAGYSESTIEADFSPSEGGDILVKVIDLEKALGYSLFDSPKEYYEFLKASLFEPADEGLFGEIDG